MKVTQFRQLIREEIKKVLNESNHVITEGESAELEKLFAKLVPPSGPAKTEEGELVRAIMRIWYRYTNDGDYWFKGYGRETAGPTRKWLASESPLASEMRSILKVVSLPRGSAEYGSNDPYMKSIKQAAAVIVKYVNSKGKNLTPNTGDSR